MKKKNILLGVMGILMLTACYNEKPYIIIGKDDKKEVNTSGDSTSDIITPDVTKEKKYNYYVDKEYANPFVQDYTVADLFKYYEVRCSLTNDLVQNFEEFKYLFSCGIRKTSFDKSVDILPETKVSEAFQLIKDKYGTEEFDRYFDLKMTDSKGVSFSQLFFYDYFLPNRECEVNYPDICKDIGIPQYEGKNVQYYIYETPSYSNIPFGLRVYGSNEDEFCSYYSKLIREGFTRYKSEDIYDDVVRIYEKDIDDMHILHLEIVSSCNRRNRINSTFEYDLCGSIIVWPRVIRKPSSGSVTYKLPEELIELGIPEFQAENLEFVYEEGETNLLFVYNLSYDDLNSYFTCLKNLGFNQYTDKDKLWINCYEKKIEQINKTLRIRHLTDRYYSYQIFEIILA